MVITNNLHDDNIEIKSMIDENGGVGMTTEQNSQLKAIYDYVTGGIISSGYLTIVSKLQMGSNNYEPLLSLSISYNNKELLSLSDKGSYQASGSGTSKTVDIDIDGKIYSLYVFIQAIYGSPADISNITLKINNGNNITLPIDYFVVACPEKTRTYNCKLVKDAQNYGIAFI